MTSATPTGSSESGSGSTLTHIDPRAPRLGQTVTMSVLVTGIILQEPLLILSIAIVLNVALLTGWRINLYGLFWRYIVIPVLGKPDRPEPASPHRFAQLMGASMSGVAVVLLFGGGWTGIVQLVFLGYAVAVVHAGAAGLGGLGGICIGCRMYKQVAFFRRWGVV